VVGPLLQRSGPELEAARLIGQWLGPARAARPLHLGRRGTPNYLSAAENRPSSGPEIGAFDLAPLEAPRSSRVNQEFLSRD